MGNAVFVVLRVDCARSTTILLSLCILDEAARRKAKYCDANANRNGALVEDAEGIRT
jgi:hypothetical protein